ADDEIQRVVHAFAIDHVDRPNGAEEQAEEEGQWMCACSCAPCVWPALPLSTCCTIWAAMSRNAAAAADCGSRTTIGSPVSPPITTFGSMGTSPRNGTPSISAVFFPPP